MESELTQGPLTAGPPHPSDDAMACATTNAEMIRVLNGLIDERYVAGYASDEAGIVALQWAIDMLDTGE